MLASCTYGTLSKLRLLNTVCKAAKRQYSNQEYVLGMVKAYDYESYVTSMLYTEKVRYPALVLHAFNTEVAIIADKVSDATTGLGRYNFWKRCLTEIFEGTSTPAEHPLIQILHQLINSNPELQTDISKRLFYNLIEARHRLCVKQYQFKSTNDLLKYSDQTKSSLYRLLLTLADLQDSTHAQSAAHHLGRCAGIITALRSTPHLIKRNQLSLPQDILRAFKIRDKDVVDGNDNVSQAVYNLAELAQDELEISRSHIRQLNRNHRVIFLPFFQTQRVLRVIQKCDYDVFHKKMKKRTSHIALRVWFDMLRIKGM